MDPQPRTSPDWVERGYLALYGLLPAGFRVRFSAEMLEFFRARRAVVRSRGLHARVAFIVRALADVLAAAWRARVERPVTTESARRMFTMAVRGDMRAAARRTPGLSMLKTSGFVLQKP